MAAGGKDSGGMFFSTLRSVFLIYTTHPNPFCFFCFCFCFFALFFIVTAAGEKEGLDLAGVTPDVWEEIMFKVERRLLSSF